MERHFTKDFIVLLMERDKALNAMWFAGTEDMDTKGASRINYIDGLRGLSILAVLLHHAYGPWHLMFPWWKQREMFGSDVLYFFPIAYGYLAVWLFFFISGFVIFISLEKRASFRDFIFHRWLRLFPAMLICSALILLTGPFFPERPMGIPHIGDAVPGLMFLEPSWIANAIGVHQGVLEGSFWSLFVEMRFYLIFGCCYFLFGGDTAIRILIGLFCFGLYLRFYFHVAQIFPLAIEPTSRMLRFLDARGLGASLFDTLDYGVFGGGALFAKYVQSKDRKYLYSCGSLLFVSAVAIAMNDPYHEHGLIKIEALVAALIFIFIVPMSCLSLRMQKFWSSRVLVFLGFISYPLYLLHQNVLVASMLKIHREFPFLPALLVPLLPAICLIGVAWHIARYGEPLVKAQLTRIPAYWREKLSVLAEKRSV